MSQNGRALISALNNGDYDAIDRLQLSETDTRIVNQRIHELFDRAISGENLPLFEALLRIPNVRVSTKDYCGLRHASQLGLVEYVQRLEGHAGVNASLKDKSGFTSLHLAMVGRWNESKAMAIASILVGFPGLRVNARNLEKKTALHYAMAKEWYQVAELLMDNQANPNVEDSEANSPTKMGLMGDLPGSLFGKMLSFIGSGDDIDDDEDLDDQDPPLPDGTMSQEEVYKQMNSHKPADMQIPPILQDPNHPQHKANTQLPPQHQVNTGNGSPSTSRPDPTLLPPPAHQRAVDPLTTQIPSVKHNTPGPPLQAAPHDPAKQADPTPVVSQPYTPDPNPMVPAANQGASIDKAISEDLEDFLSITGFETVEDAAGELNRSFLLNRSEFDPRFRLHRRAIIEQLEKINGYLIQKNQGLRAEEFRQPDPVTGFNFWHVAAATGNFETALRVLISNDELPNPEDLSARTEAGKSIPDVLEDMNRLSGVLHSDIWANRPQLLAAILSQLSENRLQQFSTLITRTNLQILHA